MNRNKQTMTRTPNQQDPSTSIDTTKDLTMLSNTSSPDSNFLPMAVAQPSFLLERLGQDCRPEQFLRELTQNSIEAIIRTGGPGEIVWQTVPSFFFPGSRQFGSKLSISDNGDGMTGGELERLINQLSASGSQQSLGGNFGLGGKISSVSRNPAGVVYQSWKHGEGHQVWLCRDEASGRYGLRQFPIDEELFSHHPAVPQQYKPRIVDGHGTQVILMGRSESDDTTKAPEGIGDSPTWISKYLNSRYFSFPQGVIVRVHEGSTPSGLPQNIRTLTGMGGYLDDHSVNSGVVKLTGALAHWWILGDGGHLTSDAAFIQSSGHVAALYQSELYEMHTGNHGIGMLQRCGVIFGGRRVVVYFAPRPGSNFEVTSNTARSNLVLNNQPLPWDDWAREFRKRLPVQLRRFVEQQGALASGRDHSQTVHRRIEKVVHLFRPTKYRLQSSGSDSVDDQRPGDDAQAAQSSDEHRVGDRSKNAGQDREKNHKAGTPKDQGKPASKLTQPDFPTVKWISVKDGTRPVGFIEDRAASYLPDQNILQINDDFAPLTDVITYCCKDATDFPSARDFVATLARAWFEQSLVETVIGVRAMRNRKEWSDRDIEKALSPEALTAAAMQKYHVVTCTRDDLLRRLPGLPRVGLFQSA
jgi:hypothetical protein